MNLAELRAALEAVRARLNELIEVEGDLDGERAAEWETLIGREAELVDQEAAHPEARAERVRESRDRYRTIQVGAKQDTSPLDARGLATLENREVRGRVDAILNDEDIVEHLSAGQRDALRKKCRTSEMAAGGHMVSDSRKIANLLLATSTEAYRSMFAQVAGTGTPVLSAEEGRALLTARAMSIGTDGAGGFAVPVVIDPTIILTSQGSANPILAHCRQETITNDVWRGLSSAGVSWGFRAEAAASADISPTIAQPTVTTQRADGTIVYSIEVGMDWPTFADQMFTMLGEGYDELLAEQLTTGTSGSNQPNGLIRKLDATASIEREVATAGAIVPADIYALWKLLPKKFRRSSTWMSSTGVENAIRQFGTLDPNFTITISEEGIERLMGHTYEENDFMSDTVSGTGTQALAVVGDFKGYLVAHRAGMTVEPIPHIFDVTNNLPTGQRAWFAWARVGGDVIVSNAFRLLVNRSA